MRRNNLARNLDKIKQSNEDKAERSEDRKEVRRDLERHALKIDLVIAAAKLQVMINKKPRRRTLCEFLTDWI